MNHRLDDNNGRLPERQALWLNEPVAYRIPSIRNVNEAKIYTTRKCHKIIIKGNIIKHSENKIQVMQHE